MNDHVSKPIDPKQLFSVLTKWIEPGERKAITHTKAEQDTKHEDEPPGELPIELPNKIPGISLQEGLMRLAGNTALYLDLLSRFIKDYSNASIVLTDLASNRQFEDAAMFAHKLRGIANNLGVTGVGEVAGKLEASFKRDQATSAESLAQLAHELDVVQHSCLELKPAEIENKSSQVVTEVLDRQAQFDAINKGIGANDPSSATLLQVLIDDLSHDRPDDSDIVVLLRQAYVTLDNFQFQDARPILEQAEKLIEAKESP